MCVGPAFVNFLIKVLIVILVFCYPGHGHNIQGVTGQTFAMSKCVDAPNMKIERKRTCLYDCSV